MLSRSFPVWVKIKGAESSLLRATLTTENVSYKCIGSVLARSGCWSFLKGGFTLSSSSELSTLSFDSFHEVLLRLPKTVFSLPASFDTVRAD